MVRPQPWSRSDFKLLAGGKFGGNYAWGMVVASVVGVCLIGSATKYVRSGAGRPTTLPRQEPLYHLYDPDALLMYSRCNISQVCSASSVHRLSYIMLDSLHALPRPEDEPGDEPEVEPSCIAANAPLLVLIQVPEPMHSQSWLFVQALVADGGSVPPEEAEVFVVPALYSLSKPSRSNPGGQCGDHEENLESLQQFIDEREGYQELRGANHLIVADSPGAWAHSGFHGELPGRFAVGSSECRGSQPRRRHPCVAVGRSSLQSSSSFSSSSGAAATEPLPTQPKPLQERRFDVMFASHVNGMASAWVHSNEAACSWQEGTRDLRGQQWFFHVGGRLELECTPDGRPDAGGTPRGDAERAGQRGEEEEEEEDVGAVEENAGDEGEEREEVGAGFVEENADDEGEEGEERREEVEVEEEAEEGGMPVPDLDLDLDFEEVHEQMMDSKFFLAVSAANTTLNCLYDMFDTQTIPVTTQSALQILLEVLPFPHRIPWPKLFVVVPDERWRSNPIQSVVDAVEATPKPKRKQHQWLLQKYAREVLFGVPGSRLHKNILHAAWAELKAQAEQRNPLRAGGAGALPSGSSPRAFAPERRVGPISSREP